MHLGSKERESDLGSVIPPHHTLSEAVGGVTPRRPHKEADGGLRLG